MTRHTTAVLCTAALLLTGCQAYEREPIDIDAHARDWPNRAIDDARITPYIDALDARSGYANDRPNDHAGTLSLRRAQAMALTFNPDLRVARLEAQVPLAGARQAGKPNDPQLHFDVLRIVESVDDPWVGGVGIGFTIPLSGRLAVAKDKAWAEYNTAWRAIAVREAELVAAVHVDWLRWSAGQAVADLWQRHAESLNNLKQTADRLWQAGEISPIEARLVAIEQASAHAAALQAQSEAAVIRRQLLAKIGLSPDTPIVLNPLPIARTDSDTTDAEIAKAVLSHPAIKQAQAEYELAEQSLRAQIVKQYPDLTIGPVYENDEGQSRIGLSGAIPVPLFNRNQRAIAEAAAARDAARAKALRAYERLSHAAADAQARHIAANARHQSLANDITPLIEAQLADIRKLIDLGELDALMLTDALRRSLKTRLDLMDVTRDAAVASAQLEYLMRPLWIAVPVERPDMETQP